MGAKFPTFFLYQISSVWYKVCDNLVPGGKQSCFVRSVTSSRERSVHQNRFCLIIGARECERENISLQQRFRFSFRFLLVFSTERSVSTTSDYHAPFIAIGFLSWLSFPLFFPMLFPPFCHPQKSQLPRRRCPSHKFPFNHDLWYRAQYTQHINVYTRSWCSLVRRNTASTRFYTFFLFTSSSPRLFRLILLLCRRTLHRNNAVFCTLYNVKTIERVTSVIRTCPDKCMWIIIKCL